MPFRESWTSMNSPSSSTHRKRLRVRLNFALNSPAPVAHRKTSDGSTRRRVRRSPGG